MTAELTATYFDGVRAQGHLVRVWVDSAGSLRAEPALFDPLPITAVRVQSRVGSTPRAIRLPTGAILETEDHVTVDAWCARHRLGGRGAHALEGRLAWVLASLAAVFLLFAGGAIWGVPWASGLIARALPTHIVTELGRGTLDVLDRTLFGPSTLAAGRQEELERLFAGLLPDDAAGYHFRLELREGNPIGANALALPDGTVVLTDELVALAGHDEELAAVLLHEVGHVLHRHGARRVVAHAGLAVLTAAIFGDATATGALVFALPNVMLESSYSREMEREADAYALERLDELAIPRERFATLFERLEAGSGGGSAGNVLRYLSTHPPTAERIASFRAGEDEDDERED